MRVGRFNNLVQIKKAINKRGNRWLELRTLLPYKRQARARCTRKIPATNMVSLSSWPNRKYVQCALHKIFHKCFDKSLFYKFRFFFEVSFWKSKALMHVVWYIFEDHFSTEGVLVTFTQFVQYTCLFPSSQMYKLAILFMSVGFADCKNMRAGFAGN